jgi:hypothetical protein
MEQHIIYNDLINKKEKLVKASTTLKERFLGLDSIIDEVISLMMPWYLFPEAQLRPTIINLWGLTGSGKTALVQALVELLDHKKLYTHIDMGEFESHSASWLKHILTDDLSYFHERSALICLDEFQFARTLDANGGELGKDKLRVLWDLIDSGKIEYIPGNSTFYLLRADNCLRRLEKAIKSNVRLNKGIVDTEIEAFVTIFEGFYFENYNEQDKPMLPSYFLSEDFVEGLCSLFANEEYSKTQIRKRIMSSSLEELTAFILEGTQTRPATKTLDLSHALIFVLGNLDEAYAMSHSMNPDISADEFHEQTSKITIADIKRALRKRFRAEQIARLGNNHVIYKSFNNAQFRLLIRQELNRIATFVKLKFGWTIIFDNSVVDIVYAEGVFPAQGTRPVLTTVKNLVESRISGLVVSILEHQLLVEEIIWQYENGHFNYAIKNANREVVATFSDNANLKLENLRKSVDPELQAHTAVHEAGHAVLAALTLRIVPSVVVSRTASEAEGFCLINYPKGPMTKESLRKDIIITLGGYVAERMIFGEDFTCSGVYSDIEEASALANKAIRKYAMGNDPIHLAVQSTQNEDAFYISDKHATEAVKIIKECEIEAELILKRNKLLLLKMAEYLTKNSRMEEPQIETFVKKYGKESWLKTEGLITKDQYYSFNKVIQSQLILLEQEDDVNTAVEQLIAEINEKTQAD